MDSKTLLTVWSFCLCVAVAAALTLLWLDVHDRGALEPVSKPPKASLADERAGEGEKRHMHDRIALPSDAQAAVVVQPREGTLDHPTPSP